MNKGRFSKAIIAAILTVFISWTFLPREGHAQPDNGKNKSSVMLLGSVYQNYKASLRSEALRTRNDPDAITASGPASLWLTRARAGEVNMVTNRLEKSTQRQINIKGKAYYVPDEGYAMTMTRNPSLRFAKDPLTNRTVDKSEAIIFADASGRVLYFESEDTYRGFLALADHGTVYGYTPPE